MLELIKLQRFKDYSLLINTKEFVFGFPEVTFLGIEVNSAGVSPLLKHTQAVHDCPRPSNRLEVKHFVDLIKFYRRIIPSVARTLKPLNYSLAGKTLSFQ